MHGRSGPNTMPEEIPTGIENLLALAAVSEEFAAALAEDPEAAARAGGVELSDGERTILAASTPQTLPQLCRAVKERLPKPERRRFLELATAALVTLTAGGAVSVGSGSGGGPVALAGASRTALASITPPTGSRPDRPNRPRPDPKEQGPTRGIQPDRPAPAKPKSSGSGCNR